MTLVLGCIADDVTGGTDLALTLSTSGFRVVQMFGEAEGPPPEDADAIVVSLKVRTEPINIAVEKVVAAAETLQRWGAEQIYFKYCSTFDSTSEGNIGPIAVALADFAGASITPFVPTFPENDRTVYQGHLFVGDQLLSNSSMRDHPLTPMRESDLRQLLAVQSSGKTVGLIALNIVESGADAIKEELTRLKRVGVDFVIVDALADCHLKEIGKACAGLPLITGGSGLARGIAQNFGRAIKKSRGERKLSQGASGDSIVILSGSCSNMSNQQVVYAARSMPVLRLQPCSSEDTEKQVSALFTEATRHLASGPVLIASTAQPSEVSVAKRSFGQTQAGDIVEVMFGEIAKRFCQYGVTNFVIGGGETSGAVAAALGLKRLWVGEEIAPGVPWMFDVNNSGMQVAFKSGNFGAPSFFCDAVDSLFRSRRSS